MPRLLFRTPAMPPSQDKVVLDVCNSNSREIAHCVSELSGMQAAVADLQSMLTDGNTALQVCAYLKLKLGK